MDNLSGHIHDHGGGEIGSNDRGLIRHLVEHLMLAYDAPPDIRRTVMLAELTIVRNEIEQLLPQIAAKLAGKPHPDHAPEED